MLFRSIGQRTTMVDAAGTTTWSYSSRGEVIGQTQPGSLVLTMVFDSVGVRHEVAWKIVTQDRPWRDRVSHHPYPTRYRGKATRRVRALGQRILPTQVGRSIREGRASLPASGGKGQGWAAWSAYAIPR